MKFVFILSKIDEARLLRATAEELGYQVEVFRTPQDTINTKFIPDITIVDITTVDVDITTLEKERKVGGEGEGKGKEEEKEGEKREGDILRLIFSLSDKIIFILPFWMNAAEVVAKLRDKAEEMGFRKKKIKVAKRPFTPQELINYAVEIFSDNRKA